MILAYAFLANVNSRSRLLYVVVRPSVYRPYVCRLSVFNVRARQRNIFSAKYLVSKMVVSELVCQRNVQEATHHTTPRMQRSQR